MTVTQKGITKQIQLSEATLGGEYVTKYGKIIQVVDITNKKVKVLILFTDREVILDSNYIVYEYDEAMLEQWKNTTSYVSQSGAVPSPDEDGLSEEISNVPNNKRKILPKKEKSKGKQENVLTAKQLVWDMLKQGEQTRFSLAQAIVDAQLTKHKTVKKAKAYISVILSNLKSKHDLKIISIEPGKYVLKD